jgi:hypothetical protein
MKNVQIHFISAKSLEGKDPEAKAKLILGHVKKDVIIVIDEALTAREEKLIIEDTMKMVSADFPGVEIATFGRETLGLRQALVKMLGGKASGFSVIGPSSVVKEIKRDPDKLRLLAEVK